MQYCELQSSSISDYEIIIPMILNYCILHAVH